MYAFNRIKSKHVDFLVCDRQTLEILSVIEVDDPTHHIANRKKRDLFVDSALKQAGIPCAHLKVGGSGKP